MAMELVRLSDVVPAPPVVRYCGGREPGFLADTGFPGGYFIEVGRCDTAEKLLAWTGHIAGKSWCTARHIRQLIDLCEQHTAVRRERGA